MAIKYALAPRTIVLCDYNMGGFRPPEMVKRRPAVILTPRLPRRDGLHTVVPLSGTESDPRNLYHCRIELAAPLPHPFSETVWWAKADMLASVSFERLDMFRTARDANGNRKYLTDLRVPEDQFELIREAVRHALGLHGH